MSLSTGCIYVRKAPEEEIDKSDFINDDISMEKKQIITL